MAEWPLMIFTVFGQCVAGGFIVWLWRCSKATCEQKHSSVLLLHVWFMGADGHWLYRLYASSGSPMRAFNSLNRVGASALSTKSPAVRSFLLLVASAGYWQAEKAVTGIAYAVAGGDNGSRIVFVWMMVRVYNSIDTVPTCTASGRRWASS